MSIWTEFKEIVTILILIDGFLQFMICLVLVLIIIKVTILILIDGFLQSITSTVKNGVYRVTILILIDGFLQFSANAS